MSDTAMFVVEWQRGEPTLAEAARALNVSEADLDPSFGVVLIDPDKKEYTVLCRGAACARVRAVSPSTQGPFSDPGIGTFGPPEERR